MSSSLQSRTEGKMTYDAMRGMLASLKDPNTRFLEPAISARSSADAGRASSTASARYWRSSRPGKQTRRSPRSRSAKSTWSWRRFCRAGRPRRRA